MNIDQYTEKTKTYIQQAQNLARRRSHQALTPWHVFRVILDDGTSPAHTLLTSAGADLEKLTQQIDQAIASLPEVSGGGQFYMANETATLFAQAEDISRKAGDQFLTTERCVKR